MKSSPTNPALSWQELLYFHSFQHRATYLKIMTEVWGIQVKSIVEIGVFRGFSSKLFRLGFPDAFLYLIDPWKLYDEYLSKEAGPISTVPVDYEAAYKGVKEYFAQDQKTTILRKSSLEALADVPDEVDLVFIDGNHSYSYVLQDIEHWFPKVRRGGILSGHDYHSHSFPGVVKAVNECFPEGVVVGSDNTWIKIKS